MPTGRAAAVLRYKSLSLRLSRFLRPNKESSGPDKDNILVLAEGVRHLVARGVFTVADSVIANKRVVQSFQHLAEALLRESEIQFRDFIWPERWGDPIGLPPPLRSLSLRLI